MKPKSIQLTIPNPCHENWQQMTPCEQGRFCSTCQTAVVDFTTWSDRALYEFFSKNTAPVCGRIHSSKLDREICIPPQPTSRLYRIAIAFSLTLIFAQLPEAHAGVKAPVEMLSDDCAPPQEDYGAVEGRIIDEMNEAIPFVNVYVLQGAIKRGGATTDIDGYFSIKPFAPGEYELVAELDGYQKRQVIKIKISASTVSQVNLTLLKGVNADSVSTYFEEVLVRSRLQDFHPEFKQGLFTSPSEINADLINSMVEAGKKQDKKEQRKNKKRAKRENK